MIYSLANANDPFTATVIRSFNLYGPGQRPTLVLPAFVEQIVNDDVPRVYDNGTQTRCFTYIKGFVEGVVQASIDEAGENKVFNLGNWPTSCNGCVVYGIRDQVVLETLHQFIGLVGVRAVIYVLVLFLFQSYSGTYNTDYYDTNFEMIFDVYNF